MTPIFSYTDLTNKRRLRAQAVISNLEKQYSSFTDGDIITMTSDELRKAAIFCAAAHTTDSPLANISKYLNTCADALEEGPVAWHYTTVAGTRITHYADRLDVAQLAHDMKAAREYPNAHKVIPLYTHPQPQQADVEDDSRWLGPFTTATEALNELRIAVATMMGADPNTWPDHGNAPLAIAAAFGIRQNALERQSSAQADALAVPQPPNAQADADWYCSTCKCSVPGEHVTFDETHDTRCGGCGNKVSAVDPQADAVEALRMALDALSCPGESHDLGHRCTHCDNYVDRNSVVRKLIRAALAAQEGKE